MLYSPPQADDDQEIKQATDLKDEVLRHFQLEMAIDDSVDDIDELLQQGVDDFAQSQALHQVLSYVIALDGLYSTEHERCIDCLKLLQHDRDSQPRPKVSEAVVEGDFQVIEADIKSGEVASDEIPLVPAKGGSE